MVWVRNRTPPDASVYSRLMNVRMSSLHGSISHRFPSAILIAASLSWTTTAGATPAKDEKTTEASQAAEPEPKPKRAARSEKASTQASASSKGEAKGEAMKGRVGFGATRTLAGLNAILVRGYVTNRITLGGVVGAATFSHRDVDENGEFGRVRTVGAVGFGPELFFWAYQGDRAQQVHADFGLGARVTAYMGFFGRLPDERGDTLDFPVEIDVEIPVALQLFIGRRVAILPEFGVAVRIVPGSREPDQNGASDSNPGRGIGSRRGTTDGPGLGFELGDHTGLFMGIGFAYFFGKLSP
jgi:hypothetical protein